MTQPTVTTQLKAQGIVAAIQAATGQGGNLVYNEDGTIKILFTQEQARGIRNFLEKQAQKKSDISISWLPVLAPLIIKKTWPLALGALVALLLTGFIFGKARR